MEVKIPVPWGQVSGKCYGNWNGKPVLALHTLYENSESFGPLAKILSKEIYLLAIDLPGHGLSSHLPPGVVYHKADFIPLIKRVVDHQKWSKFSFIGHGFGAELAILFSAAFPTLINSLTLLDQPVPNSIPTSISNFSKAQLISNAIDKQYESDELYELQINEPEILSFQDGVEKMLKICGNEISQDLALPLFERGFRREGEGWICLTDMRVGIPDSLDFSEEQCYNILQGLSGLPILYFEMSESEKSETGREKGIAIMEKVSKSFKKVKIEGKSHAHMIEPHQFTQPIEEWIEK